MQVQSIQTIRKTLARRGPLVASGVVLAWSFIETANLAVVHHTGPELYGVLAAALSTAAAGANVALLRSPRRLLIASAGVLLVWTVVAFGGIAGTVAHIVGPSAEYGPVDLRPRPIVAPLIFTLLGSVGGAALFLGEQMRIRAAGQPDKE